MLGLFLFINTLCIRLCIASLVSIYRIFILRKLDNINQKVAVITGGGSGIGREICLILAEKGAKISIWDINIKNAKETAHLMKSAHPGVDCIILKCDISIEREVKIAAKLTKERLGQVCILINNAGICQPKFIEDYTSEEINKTINVNLKSHYWTIREFLPSMKKLRNGYILAISSMSGKIGSSMLSLYSSSKFGIVGLMESLDSDLIMQGFNMHEIILTTVCTSTVNTPLKQQMTETCNIETGYEDLPATYVARKSVDSLLRHERLIYIPFICLLQTWAWKLIPIRVMKICLSQTLLGCSPNKYYDYCKSHLKSHKHVK